MRRSHRCTMAVAVVVQAVVTVVVTLAIMVSVGGDVGCLWLGLDFLSFAAASVMRLVLVWLLEMVERLGVGLALP